MSTLSQRDFSSSRRSIFPGTPAQQLVLQTDSSQEVPKPAVAQSQARDNDQHVTDTLQHILTLSEKPLTYGSLSLDARQATADQEALLGGDFFDCFPVGDGRLAIAVGDVCGSGIDAAACVPGVRFALRAFLGEHRSPCTALALLNNLLCAQQSRAEDPGRSVALALILIDDRTGEAECVTAGGEPPLVLRLNGGWDAFPTTGMLLGIEAKQRYHSTTQTLGPGDMVVMATDGITEAHMGQSFLGYYGMAYLAVTAHATAPLEPSMIASHVAASILNGTHDFAGGRLHDDACVVAVRYGGP